MSAARVLQTENQMIADPAEWARLCRVVQNGCGLDLRKYRRESLDRRISRICIEKKITRWADLLAWLTADPQNVTWTVDRLAINVSEMFRDPERWASLREKIVPELKKDRECLRCWSAGCSSGAEAFSLAILLAEEWPADHSILATDIDESVLRRAKSGLLWDTEVAALDEPRRARYLNPTGKGGWRMSVGIRDRVKFERHDLLSDPVAGSFDLIVCRNVAIYLNPLAKQRLYTALLSALRPGGVLFVGDAERIYAANGLAFDHVAPNFYMRLAAAPVGRWRV